MLQDSQKWIQCLYQVSNCYCNCYCRNGKSVSEGFVLNLLTDILCALYDLHARHVVHGNVDMDCIMVDGTSKFLLGGLENSRISSFGYVNDR